MDSTPRCPLQLLLRNGWAVRKNGFAGKYILFRGLGWFIFAIASIS